MISPSSEPREYTEVEIDPAYLSPHIKVQHRIWEAHCPDCSGTGWSNPKDRVKCEFCKGEGFLSVQQVNTGGGE